MRFDGYSVDTSNNTCEGMFIQFRKEFVIIYEKMSDYCNVITGK